jgi:glycosyltransferase involved in cell wall biosynthesis
MAVIVIADDTNAYHGRSGEVMALGGTESSVIHLAEALAANGHRVCVLTRTDRRLGHNGVEWGPLDDGHRLAGADLYLPVQHPRLFGLVPRPRRLAVWLIWPVNNLRHYKQIPAMWRYRPVPVVASQWQAREYSWVLPRRNPPIVIPLAVEDGWRGCEALPQPPPPRAVYASMPQRGLPWLLPVWQDLILPRVPGAEFHVLGLKAFARPFTDAVPDLPWTANLNEAARASLRVYPGLPRDRQRDIMRGSRVYLYGGHRSEAFCLAAAEAQALGVPAVVGTWTVLPERVRDGRTGFIRDDRQGFADAAVRVLTDDALWARQHQASIAEQQGPSWADVAAMFERALL